MASSGSSIMNSILHDPGNKDVLSVLRGIRNGIVYGIKIRLPHATVMTFLFRGGRYENNIYIYLGSICFSSLSNPTSSPTALSHLPVHILAVVSFIFSPRSPNTVYFLLIIQSQGKNQSHSKSYVDACPQSRRVCRCVQGSLSWSQETSRASGADTCLYRCFYWWIFRLW